MGSIIKETQGKILAEINSGQVDDKEIIEILCEMENKVYENAYSLGQASLANMLIANLKEFAEYRVKND